MLIQHKLHDHCLTCADEAVAARVRAVEGLEAVVAVEGVEAVEAVIAAGPAAGGEVERVAIDLVPEARPGDLLLCHAGIALERLEAAAP